MKLTVYERIILGSILPRGGEDFIILKLLRKLREALSFSEKENAEIGFRYHWRCPKCQKIEIVAEIPKCPDCDVYMVPTGEVTWDNDKANKVIKDVFMGAKMLAICESTLKKLEADGKLKDEDPAIGISHMSLYGKFIEGADEVDVN